MRDRRLIASLVGVAAALAASGAYAEEPDGLSPVAMFLGADVVVKTVMVGLACASLATWTVWLAKGLELVVARSRARRAAAAFERATSLDAARLQLEQQQLLRGAAADMMRATNAEFVRSRGLPAAGVKERAALILDRIEARALRASTRGAGLIATVGATAPFVGLFGTVWGIMNSFVGISRSHTSSLAVVAPGIAEALLATAAGLVAAIPAVVLYNLYARSVAAYRADLGDAASALLRQLSHDLDRGAPPVIARAAE